MNQPLPMSALAVPRAGEVEFGLLDIVDFFRDNGKFIVTSAVFGAAIGAAYAWIAPSKYEATANFQTAKVANTEVEPSNLLLAKLKMPLYYSQNSIAACGLSDELRPGVALAKALKPMLEKTVPIISISYKSTSPEKAKICLENVLNDIRKQQDEVSAPLLKIRRTQLSTLKEKLEATEAVLKVLDPKKPRFDINDSKFSASALLLATTLGKDSEAKDLRAQVNDLETTLSEPQTKQAYLATPIYAPNDPANHKPMLVVFLALMTGTLVGSGYVLGRRVWANIQLT